MKILTNSILSVLGCFVILTLVCINGCAQLKTKQNQKHSAKTVKCKTNDYACFIQAANSCRRATLTMNKSLLEGMMNPNQPHPTYTRTDLFEIRGLENGQCIFYSKIEKADVKYNEDYILSVIKEEGKTRQEVEQIMAEERKGIQQTAGRNGVCSFPTPKLVAILNGWWQKDGGSSVSSKDFEGAKCQGTLYNFTLPTQTLKLPK
jgi:hypothetical protein